MIEAHNWGKPTMQLFPNGRVQVKPLVELEYQKRRKELDAVL
jgi:hypothetical protein